MSYDSSVPFDSTHTLLHWTSSGLRLFFDGEYLTCVGVWRGVTEKQDADSANPPWINKGLKKRQGCVSGRWMAGLGVRDTETVGECTSLTALQIDSWRNELDSATIEWSATVCNTAGDCYSHALRQWSVHSQVSKKKRTWDSTRTCLDWLGTSLESWRWTQMSKLVGLDNK